MGSLELGNGGFSAALRRRTSSRLTRAVLDQHGYVCLELVSTCEGTLGLGRITIGNGQVAPAVPRVALREAGPSSKPIAITGFRP